MSNRSYEQQLVDLLTEIDARLRRSRKWEGECYICHWEVMDKTHAPNCWVPRMRELLAAHKGK